MRERRYLMLLMAALLTWCAVRLVPSAFAYASAAVDVGGSMQVGQGTLLLNCSAPPNPSPNPLQPGSGKPQATAAIQCTNNMDVAVTVTGALVSLTPTVASPPAITASTTSIALPKSGGTGSSTITIQTNTGTTKTTYTLTISTTATATNGLDYAKTHTIIFKVN